jgi:hypothetical protein
MKKIMLLTLAAMLTTVSVSTSFAQDKEKCKKECTKKCKDGKCDHEKKDCCKKQA